MNQGSVARRIGLWVRPYITVFDPPLIAIVGCLCVIGIVTLYSAGNDFPWRVSDQLRNFAIALAVMFVIANVSPQMLMRIAVPIYLVGLALLVATTVNGVIVKGAQRWLDIGVGRIQPAEIMPWLLEPDHSGVMVYPRPAEAYTIELTRLYAFGIDAYRIATAWMKGDRRFELDGVTGRLLVDRAHSLRVERVPLVATYRDGQLRRVDVAR